MSVLLKNPILPGGYPDPSICRKGDDFYLVASSFSYFPGVPIFHSRDLAHWEQIGHVLDRPGQLALAPFDMGRGIFAPTIRYHGGTFYVITTNASSKGNFIVTAQNPEGPWSDPHWIEGAEGIDPSLFWDEDGKAYYTGATEIETEDGKKPMIWLSEIDLTDFKLVGKKEFVWGGSLSEPAWPEAPHLYKKDGYYYLMIAEGGTEHFHSETIARSKQVRGPYSAYQGNPILTQRHLGMEAAIANAGHGDLVECQDGSFYMVFLASRPYGGYHKNLGRETFIAPVKWEEGWPVVSPGTGSIQFTYEGPDLPEFQVPAWQPIKEDFDRKELDFCWNYLGTPDADTCVVEDGFLKIRLCDKCMGYHMKGRTGFFEPVKAQALGFLGRRQQHKSFTASTRLCFKPKDKQTAGMTVLQHDYQQLRMEMGTNNKGETHLRAFKCYRSLEISLAGVFDRGEYTEELLKEIPWDEEEVIFTVRAKGQDFALSAENTKGEEILLARADGGFLGSETAGGYVGAYIGMFASGNGRDYQEYAAFDWFVYKGED